MSELQNKKFRSVMVVDDNQMDRYVAELMLMKSGLAENIIVQDSAANALNHIKTAIAQHKSLPELILLDINMPYANGFDFLNEYDLLPEHIKDLIFIVMLTSSIHNDDRSMATAYPYVKGVINKPLTIDTLRQVELLL